MTRRFLHAIPALALGATLSLLPLPGLDRSVASDLPEVSFSQSSFAANEGSVVEMVVIKSGDGATAIDFTTAEGGSPGASAGVDFVSTSGTLYFGSGDSEKRIRVNTIADTEADERAEVFLVRLSVAEDAEATPSARIVIPSTAAAVILNCTTPC